MNGKFVLVNIFCMVLVVMSVDQRSNEYSTVNELEDIEINEGKDSSETLYSTDTFTDYHSSGAKNNTLQNRNAESMTNSKSITKGQIVFATSEVEINEKQDRLDELLLENNQYSINQLRRPGLVIDISYDTKLTAVPNSLHTIVFSVKNNFGRPYAYHFRALSYQFEIRSFFEPITLGCGETWDVRVHFWIPPNVPVNNDILGSVKLSALRIFDQKTIEKWVHIYSPNTIAITGRRVRYPQIEYRFFDNCNGKLNKDRCNYSQWSVNVTIINESGFGVKRVSSKPNGIVPETNFPAGTKNPVNFIYSSSCCYRFVEVEITDIFDNNYYRSIDVTEWTNLSDGEIIAIVIGSLLLLLLIIFFILLCVWCIRKQKHADLSYTSRYGSRPVT